MALVLIKASRHTDSRGWFSEAYSSDGFTSAGIEVTFVQDNQSHTNRCGTIRGLHFQRPPHAQAKLVSCLSGRVLDCVVDLRRGSPTWGKALTVELSDNGEHLFIPKGFAHGFVTLTDDVRFAYKVSGPYDPLSERGLAWDDPALGIHWPLPPEGGVLSEKDCRHPTLDNLDSGFSWQTGDEPLGLRSISLV